MSEVEGVVQGHRDGHGFVVRNDGEVDVYLSSQEMRAVLHRDRVRVRIVRYDRKGRPEGRVLDIIERRKAPIIGRLLHESGAWIVAPEDRRYGQDILIPKNATANAAVMATEPIARDNLVFILLSGAIEALRCVQSDHGMVSGGAVAPITTPLPYVIEAPTPPLQPSNPPFRNTAASGR